MFLIASILVILGVIKLFALNSRNIRSNLDAIDKWEKEAVSIVCLESIVEIFCGIYILLIW